MAYKIPFGNIVKIELKTIIPSFIISARSKSSMNRAEFVSNK